MPIGARWQRALVTGASSGIGRAFAERLAASGAEVVLVARREHVLGELAGELTTRQGVDVEVLPADLTDPEQCQHVEQRLADRDRPVDLLVNNAGITAVGPITDIPVERTQRLIDLNVRAVMRLTHAALPGMIERGGGGILAVSSVASLQPLPYAAVYGATKAFVTSFCQALHEELRGSGVTVTVVAPGFVMTPMLSHAGTSIPDGAILEPPQVVGAALRGLRRGRAMVVPGGLYKLHAGLVRLAPASLVRRTAGLLSRARNRGGG